MELPVIFLILTLTAMIAAAVEIHRELHHFCVTEYTVSGPHLAGLADDATLVFLKRPAQLHVRTGKTRIFFGLYGKPGRI